MSGSLLDVLSTLSAKRRGPGDPLVDPPPPPHPTWMKVAGALWIINFLAFTAIAMYLGGDAFNGYVKEGHYFLKAHGHVTEVSREIYEYSRWHVISLIASFVILFPLSYALDRRSAR
jgi:hypothetical protein